MFLKIQAVIYFINLVFFLITEKSLIVIIKISTNKLCCIKLVT